MGPSAWDTLAYKPKADPDGRNGGDCPPIEMGVAFYPQAE